MNRLVVILGWFLFLGAGSLMPSARALAIPQKGPSHPSFAALSNPVAVACTQPADYHSNAEWILPNDDNSLGNDHLNDCGVASQSLFNFSEGFRFVTPSGLTSRSLLTRPRQSIPLFVLFHTWKIIPRN
ncbi:hypothetical protein [Larkinella knui]|uniref:Uncharacterized protein n=1 Tax=Larkinella knui TaxID=2025310 RepID=A0A3P1CYL2_9BACT|nr:hypothetical protein [Larkinella knui]RRB17964.1 hypothetical protein EHT87_06735 [Larkinella knui]